MTPDGTLRTQAWFNASFVPGLHIPEMSWGLLRLGNDDFIKWLDCTWGLLRLGNDDFIKWLD